jgi:hypothetical protein
MLVAAKVTVAEAMVAATRRLTGERARSYHRIERAR